MADNNRIAVYVGSFDPITLGHLNLIERSSKLVDRLIVGIGVNAEKTGLFSPEERIDLVQKVTADMPNVETQTFDGLAVEFVRNVGARVMIRGIRPLTDIAGEFTMMMANRKLDSGIETIFLMADEEYGHVSSSLLKQITPLANDEQLQKFIPASIIPDLRAKFATSK
ncbi:pantetheine-phosphate adenylyltransferase [Bremerella cremea]|uniref:Phosphopantetheine adenylyltransferase n=1 Tax=Blastopirellula marina TaxID=124 RepID=A0A2S8FQV9_9BACT|nr:MULTISPECIES: pantetheine-phosphate adenylyltransferase [Pirellulaceae]PQO34566.1 pantetheine-phosphate adenylyltransferase [Blastopirellula marina]RCS47063.1 pantetheine-phosphate adenylyltransferase [Bremerella cremea]